MDEYRDQGEHRDREVKDRFDGYTYTVRDWIPQYHVRGNKSDGYHVEDRTRMHDLGRVIAISECDLDACLEEVEL